MQHAKFLHWILREKIKEKKRGFASKLFNLSDTQPTKVVGCPMQGQPCPCIVKTDR